MKLLLDTHVFIQLCSAPQPMPRCARDVTDDPANEIYLSIASPWEMQIKVMLDKLKLAKPVEELVQFEVARGAIRLLPIQLSHVSELAALPSIHRDPFDRMIIAQARGEGMKLISGDEMVHRYPVECIWD